MMTDWIYLAKKTHKGAEMMLIPDTKQNKHKTKYMKLTLEVLVVLFRLYF